MLEAVLLFCLIQNPTSCVERSFPMDLNTTNITPWVCMIQAQQTAAKFIEVNQEYRLAKFGCSRVHQEGS